MRLSFDLTPDDWGAFGEYIADHSASIRTEVRRAQVIWSTVGAVVAAAVWVFQDSWILVVTALAVTAWVVLRLPRDVRASTRRQLAAQFAEGAGLCAHGTHVLEARPDGLANQCDVSTGVCAWRAVHEIVERPEHVFVMFGGGRGLVIPRVRVTSGDLAQFVAAARQYLVPSGA